MKRKTLIGCGIALAILLIILFSFYAYIRNSYNSMVQMEETVKERWSQVENVYQRRMDLIPNLVETVKGYASHEQETFAAVTEARAKAGGMLNISDEVLNDPAMMQKFQAAQNSLGGALQRLMVIQERYPELKANQNFLSLQDQLEGTENRISVERRRFNESARDYNIYIRQFPQKILANMFGFQEKAFFKATEGAEQAPKVEF